MKLAPLILNVAFYREISLQQNVTFLNSCCKMARLVYNVILQIYKARAVIFFLRLVRHIQYHQTHFPRKFLRYCYWEIPYQFLHLCSNYLWYLLLWMSLIISLLCKYCIVSILHDTTIFSCLHLLFRKLTFSLQGNIFWSAEIKILTSNVWKGWKF